MVRLALLALLLLCTLLPAYAAPPRYVTDQLVVSLRQSAVEGAPVVTTLHAGDVVEILAEQGRFLQVRTAQGKQGFVLGQYITDEAPAATLLARSQKELARLQEELAKVGKERDAALAQLKNGVQGADNAAMQKLQGDLEAAEGKYQALAASAKDVVVVTEERDRLKQELALLSAELESARQQGDAPRQPSTLRWFFAGAGVLFFGWILGKASRQKRRF